MFKEKGGTHNTSLASIIRALLLRNIRSMSTHTRSENAIPMSLCLKHQSRSSRAEISTIEVDSTHAVPILDAGIQTTGFRGDTSIGNHDIETTEVLDDCCDGGFYLGVVLNLDFVGCGLDAEVLGDYCGLFLGVCGGGVPDCYLGVC